MLAAAAGIILGGGFPARFPPAAIAFASARARGPVHIASLPGDLANGRLHRIGATNPAASVAVLL